MKRGGDREGKLGGGWWKGGQECPRSLSRGGGDREGGLNAGDELVALIGEGAEVAFHLDAVPEGVGLAEEDAEADRHGRSDGAFAEHDLVDRPRRHADGAGHGVLGDAHGLKVFLQQDFTGGDGSFHGL